jgi:RecB family endonuclease NucS
MQEASESDEGQEVSEPDDQPIVELASDGDLVSAVGPTLEVLFDGRVQQKVDLGRGAAGFEAIDHAERLTLIEVKAGTADESHVAAVLERLRRYRQYRGPHVRAILIAKDFTPGALDAGQTSDGLDLQSYQVALSLGAPRPAP